MSLQTLHIYSPAKNGYRLDLKLTEESTNAGSNTSLVNWELILWSLEAERPYSFDGYKIGRTVRIDGVQVFNASREEARQFSIVGGESVTLASGSRNITHSADGTKTFSASASMDMVDLSYTPGKMSLSGSRTLTPITRPTATLTVSADNTGTVAAGLTDFVQGCSKLAWSIGGSGTNYALKLTWQDGTEQSFTGQTGTSTEPLAKAGNATVTATVTGGGTATQTITVTPYGAPVIDLQAWRWDSDQQKKSENGADVQFTATATAGGAIGGAVTMAWSVKDEENEVMDSGSMDSGDTVTVTELNAEKAYRVTVTAEDALHSTASKTVVTASSIVTLSLKRGGKGAAFGKNAEKDNTLDVPWNVIGRVYGLGEARDNITTGDLNDRIEPGVYRVQTGNTKFVKHTPPSHSGGTLRVWTAAGINSTSYSILQEYIDVEGYTWRRKGSSSGAEWETWKPRNGVKTYKQGNGYRLRMWNGNAYVDAVDTSGVTGKTEAEKDAMHINSWWVSLVGDNMVTASYVAELVQFSQSSGYGSSVLKHSNKYFLGLPFAMDDISLVGTGDYGIYVSQVQQDDGPAGVSFRLISPMTLSPANLFTLRLQLVGRLADVPENPPEDAEGVTLNNSLVIDKAESYFKDSANGDWRTKRSTQVADGQPGYVYSSKSWNASKYNRLTDEYGNGLLECDGFVRMVLNGLNYTDSPYTVYGMENGAVKASATFSHTALPANLNGDAWVAKVNALLIGERSPKTYSAIDENNQNTYVDPTAGSLAKIYYGKNMRVTYHMLWAFWMAGRVFSDASQLRSGDIAFWADHGNENKNQYFECVTHIGIIGVLSGVPYLYEVTDYSLPVTGGDPEDPENPEVTITVPVMQRIPLSEKMQQPTIFARPDYSTT